MKKRYVYAGIVFFLLLLLVCGCAANRAATMHLRRAEGTVQVQDDKARALDVREDLGLYDGYGVDTAATSYAWVDLDEVKLSKLDENTEVKVRRDGSMLEMEVLSGSVFFNITQPLTEEESLTIRASDMVVGIRGTCGWVELLQENSLQVYILEGTVACTVTGADGQQRTESVSGGQSATLTVDEQGQPVIELRPFSENDVRDFVLAEVKNDAPLCDKIAEASGLQLLNWEPGSPGAQDQSDAGEDVPKLAQYCLGDFSTYELTAEQARRFAGKLEGLTQGHDAHDATYAVLFNAGNGVTGMLVATGDAPSTNEYGYVQMEGAYSQVKLYLADEPERVNEYFSGSNIQLFDGYLLKSDLFFNGCTAARKTYGAGFSSQEEIWSFESEEHIDFAAANDGMPKTAAQVLGMWQENALLDNGEMPQAFAAFYSTYWLVDPEDPRRSYPAEEREDWDTCIVLNGMFPVEASYSEGLCGALAEYERLLERDKR